MRDPDEQLTAIIHVSAKGCKGVNCGDCPLFNTPIHTKERTLCKALQAFDNLLLSQVFMYRCDTT